MQGIPQVMPAGGGYSGKGMSGEGAEEELCNLLEIGAEREGKAATDSTKELG